MPSPWWRLHSCVSSRAGGAVARRGQVLCLSVTRLKQRLAVGTVTEGGQPRPHLAPSPLYTLVTSVSDSRFLMKHALRYVGGKRSVTRETHCLLPGREGACPRTRSTRRACEGSPALPGTRAGPFCPAFPRPPSRANVGLVAVSFMASPSSTAVTYWALCRVLGVRPAAVTQGSQVAAVSSLGAAAGTAGRAPAPGALPGGGLSGQNVS